MNHNSPVNNLQSHLSNFFEKFWSFESYQTSFPSIHPFKCFRSLSDFPMHGGFCQHGNNSLWVECTAELESTACALTAAIVDRARNHPQEILLLIELSRSVRYAPDPI